MKIGTVLRDGEAQVAVAVEGGIVLLKDAMVSPPRSVLEVIEGSDAELRRIAAAVATAKPGNTDGLRWLPPLPKPGKVLCLALNNSANKSRIMSGPTHPAMFIKPSSSLIGHGEPIRLRADWGRVHPEPELVVVIGRTGSDIAREDAMEHVFGYTIINDLTAPLLRGEDTFHYRAIHPRAGDATQVEYVDSWVSYPGRYKGIDTFGPIGPWIATRDSIDDPHALTVRCLHKGAVVTEDSTENLTHKVADVIAFASSYMTLEAGEIISMGTALMAAGSGGQAVQNIDLTKLGGPIAVEISGIGMLSNPVEYR
jgi:2-keto-4-pentenoate hydratase/2-oxohepta-3-ene-1,7-dioic acid hydratase in catechol pathway